MLAPWFLPGLADGGDDVSGGPEGPPDIVFNGEPLHAFCWPNWTLANGIVTPTAYGSGFVASLPASNAIDTRLERPARTVDLNYANTVLRGSLIRTRPVKALIAFTNASVDATYRVTLAAADADLSGAGLYRSAWLPTWPQYLTDESARNFRVPIEHVLPQTINAVYWQFEIRDSTNVAGYVDFNYVTVADLYSPEHAMDVSANIMASDPSDVVATSGGTKLTFDRPKARAWNFAIDLQMESRAFISAFEMQCDLGKTRPFYFFFDVNDDPRVRVKRSFLCTQADVSPLEWSASMYLKSTYKLEEWR